MRQRKTMGNRQMSQSDIMNSHTLMRPIYCRHQRERGGQRRGWENRGEERGKKKRREEERSSERATWEEIKTQACTNMYTRLY